MEADGFEQLTGSGPRRQLPRVMPPAKSALSDLIRHREFGCQCSDKLRRLDDEGLRWFPASHLAAKARTLGVRSSSSVPGVVRTGRARNRSRGMS
jgi:hypothetical protein